MEDITGFENQIGVNFNRFLKRAIKNPTKAVVRVNKPTYSKVQTPRGAAMDKAIAKRIATGKPIPAKFKLAIDKRRATGKPLPPAIKRAVAIKKPIAAKTIAPAQVPYNKRAIQNRLKQIVATKRVERKEALRKPISVNALTRVTAPVAVVKATPVQRSFMPVDLPYKTFAPKTKPIKIPATNYVLPTDIDLVQPSVDAGTTNYYGK